MLQAGLMLSATQDVCYPNKKEVYSCQHNARRLFRGLAIGRKTAGFLAGTTQREPSSREQRLSSLIKKLFVRKEIWWNTAARR
ncbi:Aurora Kinase C [Manis pentadactyla]|nr:Aurora Kinase C [Manis pentadactyla]